MRWFRHPHESHLSDYVEGALSPDERRRLADHLADCTRCRNRVRFIRELRTALRDLPTPSPRSTLFEEIWERREAGERRILPVAPPAPPSGRRSWAAAAAIVLALLGAAAGYLLLAADEVAAGASELEARAAGAPAEWTPPDGMARWSLAYRSAGSLHEAGRVRARALYRLEGDPPLKAAPRPRVADATLRREGDRFEGELELPPTTAYALLAVESPDGERHDPGGGEPWELLARTPEGVPTYEALRHKLEVEQRLFQDGRRPVQGMIETARTLTGRYPFRPVGWLHRLSYERLVADSASLDSLRRTHRAELERLDAHLRTGAAYEPQDLAALAQYADRLEASEISARALARLERVAPDHPLLADRWVRRTAVQHADRPEEFLRRLDEAWRAGRVSGDLALQAGLRSAMRLGSAEDVLTWVDRHAPAVEPAALDQLVLLLVEHPEIAERARERLRERIRWNADPPDDFRLPGVSRAEFEAAAARRRAALLAALGRSLLAADLVAAAADTLREALEIGWEPGVARTLALAYERSGEAAGADSARALLASDPLEAGPEEGVQAEEAGDGVTPEAAADRLLRRLARAASARSLRDSAVVSMPGDPARSGARDLAAVRLGIAALWQVPPVARAGVWQPMREWRDALEAAGVEPLVILSPAWAYEADRAREASGWAAFVDSEGGVLPKIASGWARQYAVLVEGRAFVHADVESALRHVLLLARRSR